MPQYESDLVEYSVCFNSISPYEKQSILAIKTNFIIWNTTYPPTKRKIQATESIEQFKQTELLQINISYGEIVKIELMMVF